MSAIGKAIDKVIVWAFVTGAVVGGVLGEVGFSDVIIIGLLIVAVERLEGIGGRNE